MRGFVPYAWRGLVARPARSLLTIFGIAIGVAVLVAALATSAGLDASIERTVASIVGRADLRVAAFAETGLSDATAAGARRRAGRRAHGPGDRAAVLHRLGARSPDRHGAGHGPGHRPGPRAPRPRPRRRPRCAAARHGRMPAPSSRSGSRPRRVSTWARELSILGAGAPVKVSVAGILAGDGPALGSSGRTVVAADRDGPPAAAWRTGRRAVTITPCHGITRVDVVLAAGADLGDRHGGHRGRARDRAVRAVRAPATSRRRCAPPRPTSGRRWRCWRRSRCSPPPSSSSTRPSMTVVERIRELGLLRAAGASRGQLVRDRGDPGAAARARPARSSGSRSASALALLVAAWLGAVGSVTLDAPELTPPVLLGGPRRRDRWSRSSPPSSPPGAPHP